EIGGRHDACIAMRAGVVVESAIAIALADLYLLGKK
ncbi:MAG: chorismate synthase, partial [Alistipes sp.]|nr:chorismate synthase [Alistipes sp.]